MTPRGRSPTSVEFLRSSSSFPPSFFAAPLCREDRRGPRAPQSTLRPRRPCETGEGRHGKLLRIWVGLDHPADWLTLANMRQDSVSRVSVLCHKGAAYRAARLIVAHAHG